MSNAVIRAEITNRILKSIESGKSIPWRKPWRSSPNAGRPTSVSSGNAYRGINVALLQMHANAFGFSSKFWATFKQWQQMGMAVKKRPDDVEPGSWGATAVLYKPITKTRKDDDGEQVEDRFFLLRTFTLFNADAVIGAERFQVGDVEPDATTVPDFGPAEELIVATGADIRHGGERAFYDRLGDYIQMPNRQRFDPPGAYYETLLHELAHFSEPRIGWSHEKEGYAMGELVAELAASMLSAELGVPQGESLENHAAYLQSWLHSMRSDSSFIFKASTQASKVADFLLSHVKQEAASPEPAIVV
ncbi:DNA primase TraC [Anatilimnocola aggregata]|uniref:DNA primase TraC n=1 Tax=Anatilimnocola aggregata TaxID=2528021 RepID=A0A517YH32_9BACT|nr:zincin-like metallopeptidase domain-containing protein [Anatilimnocola aggregata]QDU29550.1 DNA primase TraC [Anatilimnocola aggregata]